MINGDQAPPPESNNSSSERPNSIALSDQILPSNLFVLPINSQPPFPTLMAPIHVNFPRAIATVEEAINRQRVLGLILTRQDELKENLRAEDLYSTGVVVKIIKRLKMPDGSINILVHCMKRFRIKRVLSEDPYLVVESEYIEDIVEKSTELDALIRTVINHVKRISEVNPFFTDEMRVAMINAPRPGTIADLVTFALALPKAEAQDFLETLSVKSRFEKLLIHLRREQDLADLQKKISDEVNTKLGKLQREFFLKEQLKTIRKELGQEEDGKEKSTRTFKERIEQAGMSEEAKNTALEELAKFETLTETSPEYNITRGYLELICSLPWNVETEDQLDTGNARKILDEDHYGLEKVKERIIEFLAVRKLKADTKGSILCLVGPPGVGKTSVGKSIARTLGRKFYRFSLGGMRDEAEIKGHRRTYVGAMPGKIMQAVKRAGSRNAVIMLDEVDKLGISFQGDPASALLEVLDPEQNHAFLDHYLDVPFDLSKILFIITANTTATIPAPLLDRMEVIELSGYTLEEKEEIALKFVIPREIGDHGLKASQIRFERPALRKIMLDYAREPGLRTLQQMVKKLCRKAAARIVARSETTTKATNGNKDSNRETGPLIIRPGELENWLGPIKFYNEVFERITSPGVVVGLAWTPLGGDILFIEATDLPGNGSLKLTGQMGEVMSESANIAWSYVKKKAAESHHFTADYFKKRDIHLHIPAGGIPKDGPSAGISMATALYSLLSDRMTQTKLAMTGELSLKGKVLPVGGIKEKVLAARRAGITDVILPSRNDKDLKDLPKGALDDMKLHYVSHVEDVFKLALLSPQKGSVLKSAHKTDRKMNRPTFHRKSKTSRTNIRVRNDLR